MSEQTSDETEPTPVGIGAPDMRDPTEYGSLSPEDDAEGTVDPGELAGTAGPDDANVGYEPDVSQADDEA
jgi:hypothetical protein